MVGFRIAGHNAFSRVPPLCAQPRTPIWQQRAAKLPHVVNAGCSFSPVATICSAPSGSGRCSALPSSHGRAASVVFFGRRQDDRIAFGCTRRISAFGSQVRKPNTSMVTSPDCACQRSLSGYQRSNSSVFPCATGRSWRRAHRRGAVSESQRGLQAPAGCIRLPPDLLDRGEIDETVSVASPAQAS
jgi:hypothetical protein